MMRKVQALFILLMLPLLSWAQTSVNASEIIAKINRGEAVTYKDARITGDLNLTKLKNMKLKEESNNKYDSKEYISTVTAPITFINCTFEGDVLAYFNPDNGVKIGNSSNEVYNTNFEKEVRFEGCVFEEASAFKYSEFKGGASFINTRFEEEALFKYSKFQKSVNFSSASFREEANFKYVKFPVKVSFTGAAFNEEANFKYAHFQEGVNFQKAEFNGIANFKYAQISDSFNVQGASFNGGDDFKYTKLNNKQVSLASLQQMNR
ncbi:pentapeptide repeat-containing protein [Pontibacter sp. MBLB2868]|uniref:pentapeptide repeat-containing protein n=1 Tax=Pontibacter sp. MBLB2868 TaxID=3451555 RepID=UPI003F754BF6